MVKKASQNETEAKKEDREERQEEKERRGNDDRDQSTYVIHIITFHKEQEKGVEEESASKKKTSMNYLPPSSRSCGSISLVSSLTLCLRFSLNPSFLPSFTHSPGGDGHKSVATLESSLSFILPLIHFTPWLTRERSATLLYHTMPSTRSIH